MTATAELLVEELITYIVWHW